MAISQAVCTSFKQELMVGQHNFTNGTGQTFKIALYTNLANMGAATTAYTTTAEVVGTGYTAGGNTLVNVTPSASGGTTAYTSFNAGTASTTTWSTSTITAAGALIYNFTDASKRGVVVLSFGSDKTSTAGDFSIVFPTNDGTNAIIRIA